MISKKIVIASLLVVAGPLMAAPLSYDLKPQKIADNTWVLQGKLEDFSNRNGGNIVNASFVVTEDGVVVIDTGPSLKYGKEMRAVIASVTDKPIKYVFNTHQHPDHFLGNQAFKDIEILSLPKTKQQIKQDGDSFAENMYRLVGDWMRSTEVQLPTTVIESDHLTLGSHRFQLSAFSGHSGADLVIYDEKTGVLFASDIVFYQRALTTPHTPGLATWMDDIDRLESFKYTHIVPGHGPVTMDHRPLAQMKSYLQWLDKTLTDAAKAGLSMTEVIRLPISAEFDSIQLTRTEFVKTVAHLYPKYEELYF